MCSDAHIGRSSYIYQQPTTTLRYSLLTHSGQSLLFIITRSVLTVSQDRRSSTSRGESIKRQRVEQEEIQACGRGRE